MSRVPGRTVVLAAGLLITGLLVASTGLSTAAAQDPATGIAFTETEVSIVVFDGPDDDQQVTIEASLLIPETATAATPAPAVIVAHGFGGSRDGYLPYAQQFAAAGYVSLAYSSRGFGGTTGLIGLDSVDYDVKDIRQIVDYLAAQPHVLLDSPGDPRVGIEGQSYGGGISFMAAAIDDRVDAISPSITWSSLVYALSPQSNLAQRTAPFGPPVGVFKQQWTSLFFGLGTLQPITSPDGAAFPPTSVCAGFVDPLCETYARISAQGRGDQEVVDLLANSSIANFYDQLTIPTFIVQGIQDTLFNLNDAILNYEALVANGAPVKMMWHSGGHGYSFAEDEHNTTDLVPDDVVRSAKITFFDKHLKRLDVDTGPAFSWYRPWLPEDTKAAYDSADAYPIYNETQLFLSGDGTIVTSVDDVVAGDFPFINPAGGSPAAYSETAAVQPSVGKDPMEIEGQHVAFTSAPFAVPTELVGMPKITLPLSSLVGEAAYFTKFYDVAPDGTETLIARMVGPVWNEDLSAPAQSFHPALVHQFETGHALRFVVASTDQSYANRRVADVYTLSISPGSPGVLALPLSGVTPEPQFAAVTTTIAAPDTTVAPADALPATGPGKEAPVMLIIGGVLLGLALLSVRLERELPVKVSE